MEVIEDYGNHQLVKIAEKYFITKQISPDYVPCMDCHKLITDDVPLRLFCGNEGSKGELTFCFECAEKLGILKSLKTSG